MFGRDRGWLKWCGLLCGSLSLSLILNAGLMALSDRPVVAQTPVAIEAGSTAYQRGNFLEAIALWEKILPQITAAEDKATVRKNLALAYRQTGQLSKAIAQWEAAIALYRDREDAQGEVARLLAEQAQAYSDLGQHQRAIALLESALEITDRHPDLVAQTAIWGALGNARGFLGDYEEALTAHRTSLEKARQLNDSRYIAIALNNLGNLHCKIAERLRYQAEIAELEGDTQAADLARREQEEIAAARKALEESLEFSRNTPDLEKIRALMNLNRLIYPTSSPSLSPADAKLVVNHWNQASRLLTSLPNSREKAYGLINLAESFRSRPQLMPVDAALEALQQALAAARSVGDVRAQSFALGSLGEVYEQDLGDLAIALNYSRQAQFAAQQINAPDSLYRWQWQGGRIFKAMGRRPQAIAAYRGAVATLQSIRSDLIAANKDLQFDFRQQVEPVYRDLIALLLDDVPTTLAMGDRPAEIQLARGKENPQPAVFKPTIFEPTIFSPQPPQRREIKPANPQPARVQPNIPQRSIPQPTRPQPANIQPANIQPLKFPPVNLQSHAQDAASPLDEALDTLENLKIAEIQHFFGDDCVQVALSQSSGEERSLRETNTAVVYSIILGDRTHLVLQAPDGKKKHYKVPVSKAKLESEIGTLRFFLETRATEEYLPHAQKVYDWLIRPLAGDLAAIHPETLLFINDGVLRSISMAALHDGSQFLIEKYPIATTPGLHLTTLKPLERNNLEALSLGLTVAKPPFAPLTNVRAEMKAVQAILGGVQLLDRDFTRENLQRKIQEKSFPIVHLATHGKFGFDADNTFLLGYDAKFTIEELDSLLRSRGNQNPVALLVMSACQTAAGDERSALGIGGVAVRAGVEAAVATLWFINDEATVPLIKEFYTQLINPEITKAEALRRAQIRMIEDVNYSHPAVWSPFILIGNWL